MENPNEEVLYNKEKNLGVTTFTFRSKRYSFPSVIVKSDIQSEGVCVMLDVGLFCPFCSGNIKSKFMHKKSRLSISQKKPGQGHTVPGHCEPLSQSVAGGNVPMDSHKQVGDGFTCDLESLGSRPHGYSHSTSEAFEMESQSFYGGSQEEYNTHNMQGEALKNKGKLLDKGVLTKPDLSILDELEIEPDLDDTQFVNKKRTVAHLTDNYEGVDTTHSLKVQDLKSNVCITKPRVIENLFGDRFAEQTELQRRDLNGVNDSSFSFSEGEKDDYILSTESMEASEGIKWASKEVDVSDQRVRYQANYYVPRAERERLLSQPNPRQSTQEDMTSQTRDQGSDIKVSEREARVVDALKALAAIVLNTDPEEEHTDLDDHKLPEGITRAQDNGALVNTTEGHLANDLVNTTSNAFGSLETGGYSPPQLTHEECQTLGGQRTHNGADQDESVHDNKPDHDTQMADNKASYAKHGNPGTSEDQLSVVNIDSTRAEVVASGPENPNTSGVSVNQNGLTGSTVLSLQSSGSRYTDNTSSANDIGFTGITSSPDREGINVTRSKHDAINTNDPQDTSVCKQRENIKERDNTPQVIDHYFKDLLCEPGGSTLNSNNISTPTTYHSVDRLYTYDETSSEASSVIHIGDDTVLSQQAYGSSRDTLLTDELLTDDITSEDESYKNVDEETLKTIEKKLLENLAKLDVCGRKLDDQEKTSLGTNKQHQNRDIKYVVGTYKKDTSVSSSSEDILSTDSNAQKVLINRVSSNVYQDDNVQTIGPELEYTEEINRGVLDTGSCTRDSEKDTRIPSGKEMYEKAFDMLVERERGQMDIEIPPQDCGSKPQQSAGYMGCCRSYSPEVVMEQILDDLQDESETYSADATLGRVFSVRREKFIKPVYDPTKGDSDDIRDTEDIGEMYDFMKKFNSGEGKVRHGEMSDGKQDVIDYHSTKKSISLNDLLDDEISCARDLNETFSTVERGASVQEVEDESHKDLNETLTTLEDSVFSVSPKNQKPLDIDEIFENAFEHALEGEQEGNVKSWTSDYESDVRGSNDTSQSTSLDKQTSSVKAYKQYLNGIEIRQKSKTSSVECIVSDRSQSVVSETSSHGDNFAPTRISKGSSSSCSVSSTGDSESDSGLRLPVKDMVAEINKLTAASLNNEQQTKRKVGYPKNVFSQQSVHDELNIETKCEHRTVTQEELFHTPESVCAPKSPTIVQRPQISLAKMHKIPLISSGQDVKHGESVESETSPLKAEEYVCKDEIMSNQPAYNSTTLSPISGSSVPPFGRQLSMDEISEGSTMSSIDEFIPETEEYNAPPEMLEEAYHAAIEVAQMFQQHHIQHPCFQKIIEEISSSRESLYKSDGEGSRSSTLRRWKPTVSKLTNGETSEEQQRSEQPDDKVISPTDQSEVVPSDKEKQQFLQQLIGTSHTEHKQKHKEMQEICRSCAIKSNEDITVKSEEISTQEVTLIFAWPKRKGKILPKGLPPNPYQELHMHRVMKVSDLDVEILEGPTLKTITNVAKNQKSITDNQSASDQGNLTIDDAQSKNKDSDLETHQDSSTDQDGRDRRTVGPIIADVDVKVKTTKFEPKEQTLIIERQASSEKKTVENITGNIIKVLSQNNTVEVNDNVQFGIEYKDKTHTDSLQDVMLQCTVEDIALYAETFFDLVFYDAMDVACGILTAYGNDDILDESMSSAEYNLLSQSISQSSSVDSRHSETDINFAFDIKLDDVPLQTKHDKGYVSSESHVQSAAPVGDQMSNDADEMSLLALDILESTTEKLASKPKGQEGSDSVEQIPQQQALTIQSKQNAQSDEQLAIMNKDPEVLFPEGRMYSSLQDIDSLSKPKARQKRLSLSETLLESTEREVRKATSFDEITSIIDDCALTLENNLRTSGELLLKSPESLGAEQPLDEITANDSTSRHAAPSLDTIHEGTTKISKKKAPPPVKPKPKLEGKEFNASKGKVYPGSPTSGKTPPPIKPKPTALSMGRVRCISDGDINCSTYGKGKEEKPLSPVERALPSFKPVATSFVRTVSDESFNQSSSFEPAREPVTFFPSSSSIGKSAPLPIKPKSFKRRETHQQNQSERPGKSNASDTNANFMLSLEELKLLDDRINPNRNDTRTACTLGGSTQLNHSYKACTVSNTTECMHCTSASNECLHCELALAADAVNTDPLSSARSLYSTNSKVSEAHVKGQESMEDFQMEIDKFIEELSFMCQSPDKPVPVTNKEHVAIKDGIPTQKFIQKETGGCVSNTIPECDTGSCRMRKNFDQQKSDERLKIRQHTSLQSSAEQDTSGQTSRPNKQADIICNKSFHVFVDSLINDAIQMAMVEIKPLLSRRKMVIPHIAIEHTTEEVELYVTDLVSHTLADVIETLSESSDIRSVLSTECVPNEQRNNYGHFPAFTEMSQSYTENMESLTFKGNLNTLSSSEPVIVWDNETSSFKWEKTQSDPIFGESQPKEKCQPLYFGSETCDSSSLTVYDSSRTLIMSQSQDTLVHSNHLTKYYDCMSSSGDYPESSKSYSPKSTRSPTQLDGSSIYTSVSQQLCSTPSSSVSDDLDTSGSLSTLDELVELNRAILENSQIIKKHEDFLKETASIRKHSETNNNQLQETNSIYFGKELSGGIMENEKQSHYRTSLDMYINKSVTDLPPTDTSQIGYGNISESTNNTGSEIVDKSKRYPNYNRRQNEIYQKSLRVENLRRESDVSSESDVDYTEYKTFITDDLINTDIDGAEVAQYSSSPFYYRGRDNVSVGSDVLRASTDHSSLETETTDQHSFTGTMSSDASVSEDTLGGYSFHKSDRDFLSEACESFATVNKQFRELNEALDPVQSVSGNGSSELCDEVKSIVEFKAKSPQTLSAAKRPRVLVRAKTWDDVYSRKSDQSHELLSIISHHSPLSPSFSPTSSSAFNIRDDEYAKRSRLYLQQKASDISGIISEQSEVDRRLSNVDKEFLSMSKKLSQAREQLYNSTETLRRSHSVEGQYHQRDQKQQQGFHQLTQKTLSVKLPRSFSWDLPKVGQTSAVPLTKDRSSHGNQAAVRESFEIKDYTKPLHGASTSGFSFRRHSTGDIVSNSDNELLTNVEIVNVVGKPPAVPRKSSKFTKPK